MDEKPPEGPPPPRQPQAPETKVDLATLKEMSTQELTKQSSDLRDEIAELRRRLYSGEVQNVRIIRTKRKDLARILTVLSEQFTKEAV